MCPHCKKTLPGVELVGGIVAIDYNRDKMTFERGTIPCRCGARLVVLLGTVTDFVPPRELPDAIPLCILG